MKYVKKYKFHIIIFLTTFVPRFILSMLALPVRVMSDEVATISSAAFFAGKDWSGVVSKAGYYGFGYSILFTPLFRLINNPFVLYRVMIVGGALLQAGVGLIAFSLMKKYYKMEDQCYAAVCSIACSYMVVTRAMLVFNEHALIFCAWLMAALLLKLVEIAKSKEQKGKIKYSIILMAVLTYTLTLHTRSLAFWLVLAVVFVLYFVSEHRDLLSWKVLLIFGVLGFPMGKLLVSVIQKKIWKVADGETIRNGEIGIKLSLNFLSPENRGAWINIIIGQFNTASVITGGLFFVAIVIALVLLFDYLKKMINRNQKIQVEWNYLIIFMFFGMMIVGTVGALSFSWLQQTKTAMQEGHGTWKYGMRSVTYVRYMGPYMGPVLMATLAYVKQKKKLFGILAASFCMIIFTLCIWARRIYPYVKYNTYAVESYLPFSFQNIRNLDMSKNLYVPLSLVAVVLAIVFLVCLEQKKYNVLAGVLAVFLMYQYCYNAIFLDLADQKSNNAMVQKSYEWMLAHKDQYAGEEIYVIDGRNIKNHQTFYLFQFMLNDMKIVPKISVDSDVKILFTNTEKCPLENPEEYQCYRLDDNQYVWVQDNTY